MKYRSKLYNKFPAIKLQFIAGIELGVPSKDCKNFGICRITPVGVLDSAPNKTKKNCNCEDHQCEGVITVLENNEVEICFLRKTISLLDFDKYFQSGYFLVEEDHSFPDHKGLENQIHITTGKYPVSVSASLVKVTFSQQS